MKVPSSYCLDCLRVNFQSEGIFTKRYPRSSFWFKKEEGILSPIKGGRKASISSDLIMSRPDDVGQGLNAEQPPPLEGEAGVFVQEYGHDLGTHFLGEACVDQKERTGEFMDKLLQLRFDRLRFAQRVMAKVTGRIFSRKFGIHERNRAGGGSLRSLEVRPYEYDDPYDMIDVQSSLLKSLERKPGKLWIDMNDLQVFENIPENRFYFVILIDASGSMRRDRKIEAAVETAISLYWIAKRPLDKVRIFFFSEIVEEVHPPSFTVTMDLGDTTDIPLALKVCRQHLCQESGDRQVYLITDSASNTKNGRYIGFQKAKEGFLNEGILFRQNQITLNIILLDKDQRLMELGREIAKNNLGRIFFANPEDLSDIIVEDFFISKNSFPL